MDVVTAPRLDEQKRDLGPFCAHEIRGQRIEDMTRESLIYELRLALADIRRNKLERYAPLGSGSRAVFSERR